MANKKQIALGDEVKCKLTGFKGIVTGHAHYLFHKPEVQVTRPSKTDAQKDQTARWIVADQVTIVKKGKFKA